MLMDILLDKYILIIKYFQHKAKKYFDCCQRLIQRATNLIISIFAFVGKVKNPLKEGCSKSGKTEIIWKR